MSSSFGILFKSIGTAIIELLIFIPMLILSSLSVEYSTNYESIIRFIMIALPLLIYSLYLLFSNTIFLSLSAFILRYRLKTYNHNILKMIIENLVFYGLLGSFFWLQAEQSKGFLINNIRFLLLIEFGSCFIPKIGTRLSLFLLKINFEMIVPVKKTETKK
jgi:hypothetical protein